MNSDGRIIEVVLGTEFFWLVLVVLVFDPCYARATVTFICIFMFTVRETDIGVCFNYFMYMCVHVS